MGTVGGDGGYESPCGGKPLRVVRQLLGHKGRRLDILRVSSHTTTHHNTTQHNTPQQTKSASLYTANARMQHPRGCLYFLTEITSGPFEGG